MTDLINQLTAPAFTLRLAGRRLSVPASHLWLSLILLVGGLLRLAALGGDSLWLDEYHSLRVAQQARLLTEGVPADQHPPLYYLLMTAWIQGGTDEFWLRLPSALAGLLAIWGLWPVGLALGRPGLGLLAAGLTAFAPLLVWYSREARMYGVAQLAWVAAIYFYIRVLQRDRWGDAAGLALAHLAAIYLAYPGLALWLGQAALFGLLWVATGRRRGRLVRWSMAQIAVVAGFWPWLPFMSQQLQRNRLFHWRLPGLELSATLAQTMQTAAVLAGALLLTALALALVMAWRPGLWRLVTGHTGLWAGLILLLFVPIQIGGAIPRGLSIRRQLLVFFPPLILLAAWALTRLNRPRLTMAVLGLSFFLGAATYTLPPYEDWRGAAAYLQAHEAPGDRLLLYHFWYRAPLDYEYTGSLAPENLTGATDLAATRGDLFPAGARVWVLVNDIPVDRAGVDQMWRWFEARGQLEASQTFSRFIELRAYRLRPDPG